MNGPGGASEYLFVDESKRGDYLLVATRHRHDELPALRKELRGLVLPGQRRLHMTKESDRRRRTITSTICALDVDATVLNAGRRGHELVARAACLDGLVAVAPAGPTTIVLERDDSIIGFDHRELYRLVQAGDRHDLHYEHRRSADEPILAIADAIAWCWTRGSEWRDRVRPVVTRELRV